MLRRGPLPRRIGLLVAASALLVAGCGGSSHPSHGQSRSAAGATITAPARISRVQGLLDGATSAGTATSYVPTGHILADSGFRPQVDGFSFENYGNDAGPVNLRPANVEDIFGPRVCAVGTGRTCRLIPAARQWMQQENQAMADGHCMGFSVTALRFFTHNLHQDPFGAKTTVGLPIQGNDDLQSLLAEDWTYQSLPAVADHIVGGSPTRVVRALVGALRAGHEQYNLGIIKTDGTGGHAITPFAVEDHGGGVDRILVYDNNFPGVIRAVDVDTVHDRWRYVGGVNPSDTDEIYDGDAHTGNMALLPTTPGEKRQPCPFCPAKAKADPAYPVPDRLKYVEVTLSGTGDDHPHLVFSDPQGRKSGFVDGRFIDQIPGVRIVQSYSVRNWTSAPEPSFHLPLQHPQYIVTVDGSPLRHAFRSHIVVNGAGVVFSVRDLRIDPGQQDHLILPANDLGIAYLSGRKGFSGSVTLAAQFPQFDQAAGGAQPKARLVTLATGWVGLQPGAPVQLRLDPARGVAEVASTGGVPVSTKPFFVVSLDSSALPSLRGHAYFGKVGVRRGQTLRFPYLRPTGTTLPVDVRAAGGATVRRVQVPARR